MSLKLPSVSMMRGGALDVEPFLISRNTLGNGKTTTQNLKGESQMVVAESGGGGVEDDNAEVVVVVDEEAIVPK